MGDRCYLWMHLRKADYERTTTDESNSADEARLSPMADYFTGEEELEGGIIRVEAPEANYAYCDELLDWAKQGVPFVGGHSEGGGYPAGLFAADGEGGYVECEAIEDWACIKVDSEGKPDPDSEARAKAWVAMHRKVCKELGLCLHCEYPARGPDDTDCMAHRDRRHVKVEA